MSIDHYHCAVPRALLCPVCVIDARAGLSIMGSRASRAQVGHVALLAASAGLFAYSVRWPRSRPCSGYYPCDACVKRGIGTCDSGRA